MRVGMRGLRTDRWSLYDGYDLQETNFDIYVMNADGRNVRRLTTDPRVEQAPVFVKAQG